MSGHAWRGDAHTERRVAASASILSRALARRDSFGFKVILSVAPVGPRRTGSAVDDRQTHMAHPVPFEPVFADSRLRLEREIQPDLCLAGPDSC